MTHQHSTLRIVTTAVLAAAAWLAARPAFAQCSADIDCKGDRVCDAGACVSPAVLSQRDLSPACSRDTDCKGDRVCEAGSCVAPLAPPQKVASASEPRLAAAQPSKDAGLERSEESKKATSQSRVRFVPRLGGVASGSMSVRANRTVNGVSSEASTSVDDTSTVVFGADLLFVVVPQFRLGVGTLYVPETKSGSGADEFSFGSDGSVLAVLEASLPASAGTAVNLRLQGGLALLFAGGDVDSLIEDDHQACQNTWGAQCEVNNGPFVGKTIGGGAGLMFPRSRVRPRLDLLFTYTELPFEEMTATVGLNHQTDSASMSTSRLIAMAGLEL